MDVIVPSDKILHAIMEQSESLNDLYDVSTADVYFLCNDDNTKLVPAHKCVLASDSQKFRDIFYEHEASQILIVDHTLDTMTVFLKSFYCKLLRNKRENLVELTHLAEEYDAKKCKAACWNFMEQIIQMVDEDIFQVLDLAITFNKMDLQTRCLSRLMVVGHLLIESRSFVSCSRQVFKTFLSLDFIERDEAKVFIGSIQWAQHHCVEEKLDVNHPLNLRFLLGDTFGHIQFHKMNAEQFIHCLSLHADIFTTAELKNITKNIDGSKPVTDKPKVKENLRRQLVTTAITTNQLPYAALESMFGDAKTANVFFVFQATENTQNVIYAHKCVLAANSRVFKQLFYNENATNDDYPISDANHAEFNAFIKTFYRQSIDDLLTTENIIKMIELASSYEVTRLLDKCIDFATTTLCSENIFRILDLCFVHSNTDSVSLCLDWIIAHENDMNEAFHLLSLVDCSHKTVEFSLGLNFPNRSEMQVFKASIEWAKKSCQRHQMEPTPENLRMTLGQAFDLIHFSSMQPAEFFECVLNYKGMFSHDETDMIDHIIIGKLTAENEDFAQLMATFK